MSHPVRFRDDDPLLTTVRELALAFPGAQEKVSHGRPNFFTVTVFAVYGATVKGDHRSTVWDRSLQIRPDADERDALLSDERFFEPAYTARSGWIGLQLAGEAPDWTEVAELLDMSYRNTAPARLVRELDPRR